MSSHQKILIGIAVAFLLYSIIGFMVLPAVLKNTIEKKLSENLKRSVTINTIQINPYSLKVSINKFLIENFTRDDQFIAFEQLFIDVEVVSIFKRALIVKTLTLTGPRVNIARYHDLSYSFSDITFTSDPKQQTDSKPFLFSLNNIEIINGALTFIDQPKDKTHRIEKLNLAIPFLSTLAHEVEIHTQPAFSAMVNDTPFNLSGRTLPFHETRKTVFDIQTDNISIPEYLAYLPKQENLTLKSGFLDITAIIGFEMQPGGESSLTLTGDFSIKEIDVTDLEDETYLEIPRLDLKLADSNLLDMEFRFSRVSLVEPELLVHRNEEGDILPFTLIQKNTDAKPVEPPLPAEQSALKLVVDEIVLNEGTLQFNDQRNAEQFQTTLKPVEVKVKDVSTLEGQEAEYDLSMQTEDGERLTINGKINLRPLAINLQVDLQDLQIPRFSPYYTEIVIPQVLSGKLDLAAELHYAKTNDVATIRADNISALFDTIAITGKDNDKLLTIPSLSISDSSVDVVGREITIGDFSSSEGELHLVRQKDGLVILKELLRPREAQEVKPAAPGTDTSSVWMATLQNGTIDQFSIVLQDHIPEEPTTILFDNLRLTTENISTIENSKGSVELTHRIDKKATVSIKGPVTVEPLSASLAVELAGLQVKTLQPYFAHKVNLVISDGSASLAGQLKVSRNDNKKITTLFQGKAGVENFASFDPVAGEKFLKWKDLRLDGMEYDSGSFSFRIREIGWQNFYNKIIVFDNGALNLTSILKDSDDPDPEMVEKSQPKKEKKSLLVAIDSVKLENGTVDLLDRSITPNYASSLSELTGSITGLSSHADGMAEVNISGKIDRHAPLSITGTVNPLRENLSADLIFDFRDIELSPTSPYTGKYIGYTVSKGMLSLDLNYQVGDRKIRGQNKIFLDQFTLGETVDSPDAVSLPISLAISLLKNRKGEITVNVPVEGDLDDPEFSIGGVVFQAIFGLIAKAATSPFALLGALIPEGEELQYVDFTAGSSLIEEEYFKRLETIAKVMYDRPGLKMDIIGSANADQERDVLHEKQFDQLLKNEKFKRLSKKKETPPDLDEITIEPEEYKDYLKSAYKAATFDKPKNFLGFAKKLPPEQMEKLLRENIIITEDDLRLLAIQRAKAVKSFIVQTGTVEAERLFIVEPQTGDNYSGALRVEMVIK